MNATLPSALAIGLVMGFRHAFEPDHMAAVTTLSGRHSRARDALWLSLNWSLGHIGTIALVAAVEIALGLRLPARLWPLCELTVAVLLVVLGVSVIVRTLRGRWHLHPHTHDGVPHVHVHSHLHGAGHHHEHPRTDARRALGFGLMHGLAGSGAILTLLVAAAPTRLQMWGSLGAFGAGTMLGMLVVSTTLWGLVRVTSAGGLRWVAVLRLSSAAASVVVGTLVASRVLAGH